MRRIGVFVALLLVLLHPVARADQGRGTTMGVAPSTRDDKIRMEADYILGCQYSGGGNAYGALNSVHGSPTWVVPSKNAVAIMGLLVAYQVLGDADYRTGAQRAADYLVGMQQPDGCWYDQYVYTTPSNTAKSPSQTAQVMMALSKLGYSPDSADLHDRYDAMKRGAECLMSFQDVEHKTGQDDGLIGGGKDSEGHYRRLRWAHHNAYAYWALRSAAFWASQGGESEFAALCNSSAEEIAEGLMEHLYDASAGIWHIAIDENGAPQWPSGLEGRPNWIQYAPLMLDVPLAVDREGVGEWIRSAFQQEDGSCTAVTLDGSTEVTRKYPGCAFQASLVWLDGARTAPAQGSYAQAAIEWAESSGLWQTEPDGENVTGGWIDWVEVEPNPDATAQTWERFIDTSAYAIFGWSGGYDFGLPRVLLPVIQQRANE